MTLEQTSIYKKLHIAAVQEVVEKLKSVLFGLDLIGYELLVFITPVHISMSVGMVLAVNLTLSSNKHTSLFGTDVNLVLRNDGAYISIDDIGELKPNDKHGLMRNVIAGILSRKILDGELHKEIDVTDGAVKEFLELYKSQYEV